MKKLLLILPILLTGCFDYSDGERSGTVIKLSRKGVFCKTWEGEMYLGGLKKKTSSDSDGNTSVSMVANTWQFTIEDESLIPAIQKAMDSGERVTIKYQQELITFCRSDSEGSYFAKSITQ